jgi:hypothetical protein
LVLWIRNQLRASNEMDHATRLDLEAALAHVVAMDRDDERAVETWKWLQRVAPKVWDATKPVRDVLIGEGMKKLLGL